MTARTDSQAFTKDAYRVAIHTKATTNPTTSTHESLTVPARAAESMLPNLHHMGSSQ